MTDTVHLPLTNCNQCPHRRSDRYYTADSFETMFEWTCTNGEERRIAILDWNDTPPAIPQWCPLRAKG